MIVAYATTFTNHILHTHIHMYMRSSHCFFFLTVYSRWSSSIQRFSRKLEKGHEYFKQTSVGGRKDIQ